MIEQKFQPNSEAEVAEAVERYEERRRISLIHDLAQWEKSQSEAVRAIYRDAESYFQAMSSQHLPWYRELPDDPAAKDIVQFYYGDKPPGLRDIDDRANVKLFEIIYWNFCLVKGLQRTVFTK
ncbi:hypothetical protein HYW39_00500 [Candidatus Curtissbacteria bacterium]|nr:hypothetical protein [Candidatus Curtissbacteria bacterium]MBI2594157.1 hypothetical protein [Candidatus Curtissbacteria bacterium]